MHCLNYSSSTPLSNARHTLTIKLLQVVLLKDQGSGGEAVVVGQSSSSRTGGVAGDPVDFTSTSTLSYSVEMIEGDVDYSRRILSEAFRARFQIKSFYCISPDNQMFQEMGLLSELTSLVMVMKDSSLQARIL